MTRSRSTPRSRPVLRMAALAAVALAVAACSATPTGSAAGTRSTTSTTGTVRLPAGVLPRTVILRRYRSARPGVVTEAKLVSLADLDRVSGGELTQCASRGCPPGALVWLVLQHGPPGSMPADSGPNLAVANAGRSDSWSLAPVDAATGIARGDSEQGPPDQLADSPWGRLTDLDPTG